MFRGFQFLMTAAVLATSGLLAWRNLRLGRGDRRGAFRLAFWLFATHSLVWLLWAHHTLDLGTEVQMIERDLGYNLFLAGLVWLLYLGLEPQVRRTWPETLIGWNRLLAGRFRDPRLGRDVLVGVLAGGVFRLTDLGRDVWGDSFSGPTPSVAFDRNVVALVVDLLVHDVLMALMILFLLVLFLVVLRRRALAVTALGLVLVGLLLTAAGRPTMAVPFTVVMIGTLLYVMTRHGVVALVIGFWVSRLLANVPLTADFGRWYAWKTGLVVALLVALVAYGYRTVTAGRGFSGKLLEV